MAHYVTNHGLYTLLATAVSGSTDLRCGIIKGTTPTKTQIKDCDTVSDLLNLSGVDEAVASGYARQDLADVALTEADIIDTVLLQADPPVYVAVATGETWKGQFYYIEDTTDATRVLVSVDIFTTPIVTDGNDVNGTAMALMFTVRGELIQMDTIAARPAAGLPDDIFYASDTQETFVWDEVGDVWVEIAQNYAAASTTVTGVVELATQAEAEAQSDTTRAVTPIGLANYTLATEVPPNARTISTTAPLAGGGDLSANRTLSVSAASTTATGVVELATAAEAEAQTDNTRAVTPLALANYALLSELGGGTANITITEHDAGGGGDLDTALAAALTAAEAAGGGKIVIAPGTYTSDVDHSYDPAQGHLVIYAEGATITYSGTGVFFTVHSSTGGGGTKPFVTVIGGEFLGTASAVGCFRVLDSQGTIFKDNKIRDFSKASVLGEGFAFEIRNEESWCEITRIHGLKTNCHHAIVFTPQSLSGGTAGSESFARTEFIGCQVSGGVAASGDPLMLLRGGVYDSIFRDIKGNIASGAVAMRVVGGAGFNYGGTLFDGIWGYETTDGLGGGSILFQSETPGTTVMPAFMGRPHVSATNFEQDPTNPITFAARVEPAAIEFYDRGSAPGTPGTDKIRVYNRAGTLYQKDDTGTETAIVGGGSIAASAVTFDDTVDIVADDVQAAIVEVRQDAIDVFTITLASLDINTTAPLQGGGNLSADRTLSVATATTTSTGVVELATQAETEAQSDTTRAVTPSGLVNYVLNGDTSLTLSTDTRLTRSAANTLTLDAVGGGAAIMRMPFASKIAIGATEPTFEDFYISHGYTTPYNAIEGTLRVQITTKNTGDITKRRAGMLTSVADHASVNQINVTGATNATPIVITTASVHGYTTAERITVEGVGGNTAANGIWDITVINTTEFSLNTSVGNGAYTSGGFVTNRSMMTGHVIQMAVHSERGGLTGAAINGDDVAGLTVQNSGTAKGTDAIYIAASPAITGDAWWSGFTHQGEATNGMLLVGTYSRAAAQFNGPILFADSGSFVIDARLRRTATKVLTLDDGAGGAAVLNSEGSIRSAITSTTLPAFSHATDTNTGISFTGSDGLTASTNGVVRQIWANSGVQFGGSTSFGGGVTVIGITNAATVPSTNPSGGGVLYSEGGSLKWRDSSGNIFALAAASSTVQGIVELATQAEAEAGTDTARAVTPEGLANYTLATEVPPNARTISTTAPLTGGGDLSANRTLAVSNATASAVGVVELATQAEAETATDTARAVTPEGLANYALSNGTRGVDQIQNAQTGTSYTFVLSDRWKLVTSNNGSAVTFTIPANSSVAYPIGTWIDVANIGNGNTTIAAGGGVTLTAPVTAVLRLGIRVRLVKIATDSWLMISGPKHAASVIFTPTGTIAATDVQAAIAEVATEAIVPTASTTVEGKVELATQAEAEAGTDTTRAVTPEGLANYTLASEVPPNARTISTTAPLAGGGDLSANRTLTVGTASETATGVVELATTAEATAQTDTARAVTPAGLADRVKTSRSISTTAPLSGGGDLSADRTLTISAATATATGVVELATQAEAEAQTDNTRAVTPLGLANYALSSEALVSTRTINTTAPLTGGGDLSADRTFAVSAASTTATGVVELATQAETEAQSDTGRAVTPSGLVNFVQSTTINLMVVITQAAYDALSPPDANTYYIIVG